MEEDSHFINVSGAGVESFNASNSLPKNSGLEIHHQTSIISEMVAQLVSSISERERECGMQCTKLQEKLRQSEKENEELEKQKRKLTSENESLCRKNEGLESEVKEVLNERDKLSKEKRKLIEEKKQLHNKTTYLAARNDKLTDDVNSRDSECKRLQTEKAALQSQIKVKDEKLRKLDEEKEINLRSYKSMIKTLEDEKQAERTKCSQLKKKIEFWNQTCKNLTCDMSKSILPNDQPQITPPITSQGLANYVPQMANKYELIGQKLGVGEQIKTIRESEKHADSKCIYMLECWMDKGQDVTWKNLLDALKVCNLDSTATNIMKFLEEEGCPAAVV